MPVGFKRPEEPSLRIMMALSRALGCLLKCTVIVLGWVSDDLRSLRKLNSCDLSLQRPNASQSQLRRAISNMRQRCPDEGRRGPRLAVVPEMPPAQPSVPKSTVGGASRFASSVSK